MPSLRWIWATMGLLAVLAVGGSSASESPVPLRIVTYNVQFLPSVAAVVDLRGDTSYRAKAIGKAMAEFDIVGLNEAFKPERREEILSEVRKAWGENFHAVMPPKEQQSSFGIDSGLAILSRFPIMESHSEPFGNDSSIFDYGIYADGFAAKGMLHARLAIREGHPLDVFVTHLEATDSEVRERQYELLADFIKRYSDDGVPRVLLGDLNTNGVEQQREQPGAAYSKLFAALDRVRPDAPFVDLWLKLPPKKTADYRRFEKSGERLDYVLVSQNPATVKALQPIDIEVDLMADKQTVTLSDHPAMKAVIEYY